MHAPSRRLTVVLLAAALIVLAIVAVLVWPSSSSSTGGTAPGVKPVSVVPGPAGLIDGTAPDANGNSWVLVNTKGAANAQSIATSTGALQGTLPLPSTARVLAAATGGDLGVGLAGATSGAVDIYASVGSTLLGTVPLAGPVRDLVASPDGHTFYALVEAGTALSVAVIDAKTMRTSGTIALPAGVDAIAVSSDGLSILGLEASGHLVELNSTTGTVEQKFAVPANGYDLAESTDGSTIYLLRRIGQDDNVAVVDASTESVVSVLPASTATQAVEPTADNSELVDFVGTERYGNLQIFSTNR